MPAEKSEARPADLRTLPRFEEPETVDRACLIGSRIEILRILRSLHARNAPVVVSFGGEEDFLVSSIAQADPDNGWLTFLFGLDKHTNARLLGARRLGFICTDDEAKVEFLASGASEAIVDGRPAFRVPFPTQIIRLRRRKGQRYAVPAHGPVQITLNFEGFGDADAMVVDMSRDGIGMVSYPADIRLEPGEILRGCTLRLPTGSVKVDLMIRHSTVVMSERGERLRRTGCQFTGDRRDLKQLLRRFIVALKET